MPVQRQPRIGAIGVAPEAAAAPAQTVQRGKRGRRPTAIGGLHASLFCHGFSSAAGYFEASSIRATPEYCCAVKAPRFLPSLHVNCSDGWLRRDADRQVLLPRADTI